MEHTISNHPQLRLRVFAGPNGSGKSTVIRSICQTSIEGRSLYLGDYVNADDIASDLRVGGFSFSQCQIQCKRSEIISFAEQSGLLSLQFNKIILEDSFLITGDRIVATNGHYVEYLAQVVARFLREKLLVANRRFSFETVFSHSSNTDIMRRAREEGYKVYLYFVSTEDPEINKYRVKLRAAKGGHDVPSDKIESRYYRSLELVRSASEIAYQAYFFDNSVDGEPFRLVGHFKRSGDEKVWDDIDESVQASWFRKYCR